jgi:cytoskeleton protein RodZ
VNNILSGQGAEAPAAAGAEPAGPGATLAARRTARGLAVAEVAGRLKFAARQIDALEADDYARLPGTTIVRGMIRSYAKLLETEPEPLLEMLQRRHVAEPAVEEAPAMRVPFPDGRVRSTRVYLALSAVIVLAVAGVVLEWQFGLPSMLMSAYDAAPDAARPGAAEQATEQEPQPLESAQAERPREPARAPEPARAGAAPARTAALQQAGTAAGARIALEFPDESWVEVRDRSGTILMSQLNPAGSRRTLVGEPPLSVVIGNANRVRMSYNDAPFDLKPHIKVEVARLTLN